VLLGLFAGAALLLAGIGLYGVIAYAVAQRTREFGIRVALGASRLNVLTLILRQGLRLVVVGLVLGLAAALSLTHLLAKMLYEITPTDPITFGVVSILLLMVGLLACLIPAQRATKVEPLEALRYE
jgi:putative ABC transport system permease protein